MGGVSVFQSSASVRDSIVFGPSETQHQDKAGSTYATITPVKKNVGCEEMREQAWKTGSRNWMEITALLVSFKNQNHQWEGPTASFMFNLVMTQKTNQQWRKTTNTKTRLVDLKPHLDLVLISMSGDLITSTALSSAMNTLDIYWGPI